MADALDDTEKLIARATAAITEAKRLSKENRDLLQRADARLRNLYFRSSFHPKTLRLLSPLDFPERRRAYQPFPNEYPAMTTVEAASS